MKDDRKKNDLSQDYPRLGEIFEALRRGRHLSVKDGDLFHALKQNEEKFTGLFEALGFKLEHHARDFYYFHDASNFTDLSARMAVFLFILVESLADRGEVVADVLMTRRFVLAELPHLQGERYQAYMREAGIVTPEDLAGVVRTFERFGFARRLDAESFVFEAPAYRFLDLCLDLAATAPETEETP